MSKMIKNRGGRHTAAVNCCRCSRSYAKCQCYKCNLIDIAATINYFRVSHAIRSISSVLNFATRLRVSRFHHKQISCGGKECASTTLTQCERFKSNSILRWQSLFHFSANFLCEPILFTYSSYPHFIAANGQTLHICMHKQINIKWLF